MAPVTTITKKLNDKNFVWVFFSKLLNGLFFKNFKRHLLVVFAFFEVRLVGASNRDTESGGLAAPDPCPRALLL